MNGYSLKGYRPWRHELLVQRLVRRVLLGERPPGPYYVTRRSAGTPEQVHAALAALRELERVSEEEEEEAMDREAALMGLADRARRRYSRPLSPRWDAANEAAARALDQVSPWQEARIRARV